MHGFEVALGEDDLLALSPLLPSIESTSLAAALHSIVASRAKQTLPEDISELLHDTNVSRGVYGRIYSARGPRNETLVIKHFVRRKASHRDKGPAGDAAREKRYVEMELPECVPAAFIMTEGKPAVCMPKFGKDLYLIMRDILTSKTSSSSEYVRFACACLTTLRQIFDSLIAKGIIMVDVKLENVLVAKMRQDGEKDKLVMALCDYGALSDIGERLNSGCTYGAPEYNFSPFPPLSTAASAKAFAEWQLGVCAIDFFIQTPRELASIAYPTSQEVQRKLSLVKRYKSHLTAMAGSVAEYSVCLAQTPEERKFRLEGATVEAEIGTML